MNLSKSMVEVGVSMVLKDRFSRESGRISNSFRTMMNDMSVWNRAVQMSNTNAFEFGKQFLGGMAKAYQYSAGVYDQVFLASKMSGATAVQQGELLKLAKEVNSVTPLTAKDIASGEKYLAMAGNSVEQIQKMIGPAAKLASIFSMNLGDKGGVADLMTNIMQTFNIPAAKATEVTDILATAVTSANMSLNDLAQSFQYSGAEFRNAKVSLGDAAAAIGVLGNQGIQASSAGTALANMMRYLTLSITGQKKGGGEMLKALGIDPKSLTDARGNLIRLDKIITILGDKLKGRSGIDISSALFNIFGVRGTRAASALLQDYWSGANKLTTLMDKVNSSSGITESLTQQRLQTPAGIIDQFKSNLENTVVTLGSTLGELFNPLLKGASALLRIIDNIQSTWGGKFVVKVLTVKTALGVLGMGFRSISSWIKLISQSQTVVTTQTTRQNTAVASLNSQYAIMEVHLANIGNILRTNLMLQLRAQGLTYNKAGQLINASTGRFVKGARVPFDPFVLMMGAAMGGGTSGGTPKVGGGSMLPGGTSTFARAGIKMGLGKGLIRGLGKVVTVLGRFGGPIGWIAAFAIPLLIDGMTGLTNSVDRNTEAQNANDELNNPESIRARNEQRFIEAVRMAIREGMKDSNIRISVDGDTVGDYTPGTTRDFTGRALGIQ